MADHFALNCPQPKLPIPGLESKPMGEDCLYLNVWAPKHPRGKLPVMVWIHGGSYILGSGDLDDTSAFTRDGVVLVSVNYRLGRLGFFAHPALTAENPHGLLGDYGILDQIAALKWVKANIAKFGGDPDRVTIFGVSAGATFTDMLMTSPLARGLFAGAIAESDPFFQPWSYMASMRHAGEPSAEDWGVGWAASVGFPAASAADLRAIPYERTLAGPNEANAQQVKPIVDGRILPERGPEAYAAGDAAQVPYIIGNNSFEGSLAAIYATDPTTYVAGLGANGPAILRLYGPAITGDPKLLGATIVGDVSFLVPKRIAARLAATHGVPTWVYHFAYVPQALRGKTPGAPHGGEVPYVFEAFRTGPMQPYAPTDADRAMAARMHAYWVNFARTGDPNGRGQPTWPRFTPQQQTTLLFSNEGVSPVIDFNQQLYDLIEPSVVGSRPPH
jgi:para-nitrobenzyl esterase